MRLQRSSMVAEHRPGRADIPADGDMIKSNGLNQHHNLAHDVGRRGTADAGRLSTSNCPYSTTYVDDPG